MLYSGPPCTHLQDDLTGMLSVPRAVHRACIEEHRAFEAVEPIALEQPDFERVHHSAHVREVLAAAVAGPQGSRYAALATYTVESCSIHCTAAGAALGSGLALALAGDFGCAAYGSASPPCLLNGLLVTAARLRDEGRVRRVLIVDGNGARSTGIPDTIARFAKLIPTARYRASTSSSAQSLVTGWSRKPSSRSRSSSRRVTTHTRDSNNRRSTSCLVGASIFIKQSSMKFRGTMCS